MGLFQNQNTKVWLSDSGIEGEQGGVIKFSALNFFIFKNPKKLSINHPYIGIYSSYYLIYDDSQQFCYFPFTSSSREDKFANALEDFVKPTIIPINDVNAESFEIVFLLDNNYMLKQEVYPRYHSPGAKYHHKIMLYHNRTCLFNSDHFNKNNLINNLTSADNLQISDHIDHNADNKQFKSWKRNHTGDSGKLSFKLKRIFKRQ